MPNTRAKDYAPRTSGRKVEEVGTSHHYGSMAAPPLNAA